jgi:hypothetical protein
LAAGSAAPLTAAVLGAEDPQAAISSAQPIATSATAADRVSSDLPRRRLAVMIRSTGFVVHGAT